MIALRYNVVLPVSVTHLGHETFCINYVALVPRIEVS